MALSDQERKLLEQLEASLAAEDPKFVKTLKGDTQIKIHKRYATLAGLGFIIGVSLLLFGMQTHPVVSIAGFILMLGSAIVGIRAWQRVDVEPHQQRPHAQQETEAQRARRIFMERIDEQWRRRHEGDDYR